MDKEFIPYEQALALKELGFDEPCLAQYSDKSLCQHGYGKVKQGNLFSYNCITPLYQQAFRWFREKYSLIGNPNHYGGLKHPNMACNYKISGHTSTGQPIIGQVYDNYEEAELECLKKLIEIVKEGDNG